MADIKCRCGEPWDSTGGLHHTHSSMPWWEYRQLLQGCGCPSCLGEFQHSEERDRAWQRSVQFLADGSVPSGSPYEGWPNPTWPKFCLTKKNPKEYRYLGVNEEPWLDLLPEGLKARFKDSSYHLGEHPDRCAMDEPKHLKVPADRDARKWAGVWVLLQEEKISGSDEAPVMERCNGKALEARLKGEPEIFWHLDDDTGNFWIMVAYIRYGVVHCSSKPTDFIDEIEHALEASPLLDDELYAEMENKLKEDAVEEVLGDINLAEWAGMSEEVFKAYLGTRTDAIQAEIELDKWGKVDRQPDNAFFRRLLAPVSEPQHHEILRSVVNPECLLLRQKPWEGLLPYNRQEPELCMGILIFDAKQGPRASPEVAPSTTVPLHEFKQGATPNYVRWDKLEFKFQACILDLIIGEDPDATWSWEFWSGEHAR